MTSIRDMISHLEEIGSLVKVNKEISPEYEIAAVALYEKSPILFENVTGSSASVICNLVTRENVVEFIGSNLNELPWKLLQAIENPEKYRVVKEAPFKERELSLSDIPILKHYSMDAGKYITSSIVFARDPDTGVLNASFHRLLVLNDERLAIRLVPRDLYSYYSRAEEMGEGLEVAISIAPDLEVQLASAMNLPRDMDEMEVASSLMKGTLEMVECDGVNSLAPRNSEIVIEGEILPRERVKEGPFVDITGTYDSAREEPVIKVERVLARDDPIYHGIIPGGIEHKTLMALPREPLILREVKRVVKRVRGIHLTPGGCSWLHAVISIEKASEGDAKNAIIAAFSAHPSLKHVVVVDYEVDPYDLERVEREIALKFQADRDLVIIEGARGSSLDPSSRESVTTKVGLDATTKRGLEVEEGKNPVPLERVIEFLRNNRG